jgi:hypothetical protein
MLGRRRGCRARRRLRRGRRRRRGGRSARRKQRERVDVAIRIARDADAEVDVRHIVLRYAARSYRSDRGTLADSVTFLHRDRAQVDKRYRMAAGRLHSHDLPVRTNRAREANDAGGRCKNRLLALARHVDPPVLATRVRVTAVDEGLEYLSRRRPRPRVGGRGKSKCDKGGDYSNGAHGSLLVGEIDNGVP